jgi:Ca2+-transporting ATPase
MTERVYHCIAVEQAASQLETILESGLSTEEVEKRQREKGFNELAEKPRPGFLKMLLDQFNNFLVIILIVAAVVSLLLGEWVDAIAIMVIVALTRSSVLSRNPRRSRPLPL